MSALRRSLRIFGIGAVAVCAGALSPAVSVHAQGPGQVVIRATGGDGQPVLDIKQGELSIRIDGKQREIKSLELVQPLPKGSTPAPAATSVPVASNLPSPYASNAGGPVMAKGAREFMIAIDDEGIAPGREQPIREAVKALLTSLSASDAVGIAGLKSGGMRFGPTTDHAAALAQLNKLVAMGSANESANDMGCRTRTVIQSVSALLQDAPPSRNLVVFSSGIGSPSAEVIRSQLGKQADAEGAMCQVRQRDMDEFVRQANTSAAAFYVVFVPEALANTTNLSAGEAGLQNLAGGGGGEMIRMAGTTATVEKIARTAGTYYLATVDDAGSGARRVDVRLNREGIRVVGRPTTAAAASAGKSVAPRDMIRTAAVFRDLPLRGAAFVSRQAAQPGGVPPADLQVNALFEPEEPAAKLTAAIVGLFDEKGTLKAQWTAQPTELSRAPVAAALTAAPGKYRMRIAATDATGRSGTTDVDVEVQLSDAAPLKFGTMALVGSKGLGEPKLAFTKDDSAAIGLVELYGVGKDQKVEVLFEIAKDMTGEALGTGQGTLAAGRGEDARLAYGGFPLASLEPGDYILRAVITVDGKKAGVATRTIRKLK